MSAPRGSPATKALAKAEADLRRFALGYPESHEEFPWGHRAIKVRGKIFVTLTCDAEGLRLSAKLPVSNRESLLLPFASPTHYGMGRHGWVTATFEPGDSPPAPILREWIDESYRAIAPKKLVAQLRQDGGPPASRAAGTGKARKPAAKGKPRTRKTRRRP